MRTGRRVVFERAVLLLLAVPSGCGARDAVEGPAGSPDAAPRTDAETNGPGDDAPSQTDAAFCAWSPPQTTPLPCNWAISFNGDPGACAGFGSTGSLQQCAAICGTSPAGAQAVTDCSVVANNQGPWEYSVSCWARDGSCPSMFIGNGGRRPDYFSMLGFGPAPLGREVGTHFARVACMEAGSVEAFRRLRDELRIHGAPERLVRAAGRARRDEVRHVRQTSALARRFRERPVGPLPVPSRRRRSLEEMALENAVEGCVRETYSALECMWQAHRAADPVVRATMQRIARDELRHLALSWDVHAWALPRLGRAARERVLAAQRREIAALTAEMRADPASSLVRDGGLPRASVSHALVDAIAAQMEAA